MTADADKPDWVQCAACATVYSGRDSCPRCGETKWFAAALAEPVRPAGYSGVREDRA